MKFKSILLMIFGMMIMGSVSQAAPDKWEYAVLKEGVYNTKKSDVRLGSGVELRLPNNKIVFMPYSTYDMKASIETREYVFAEVLNRLGAKGWELINVPGYRGNGRYVLKRRK